MVQLLIKLISGLACIGLVGCDDTSSLQATTGEESGSGATTMDVEEEEPAFACAGARWTRVEPRSDDIRAVVIDSKWHARFMAPIFFDEFRALELDTVGAIANDLRFSTDDVWVRFAGIDGDDNLFIDFREQAGNDPRHWLRKYDAAGKLVWETDLGPYPDTNLFGGPLVAPDGSIVMGVQIVSMAKLTLRKYDAAGALLWEIADDSFQFVQGINASGFMVASEPTGSRLRVRDPDGATLWEHDWQVPAIAGTYIDDAGNVLAVSALETMARFAPDGALLWETSLDELPIPLSLLHDLTINAAGEIAIVGTDKETHRDVAFAMSPTRELIGEVVCERMTMQRVAIDPGGGLYVGGYHFRNGAYDAVMTAFD